MKLTLRDLFWLVLVAAISCGWWVDRSRMERQRERHFESLEAAQSKIESLHNVVLMLKDQLDVTDAGPFTVIVDGETIERQGPPR